MGEAAARKSKKFLVKSADSIRLRVAGKVGSGWGAVRDLEIISGRNATGDLQLAVDTASRFGAMDLCVRLFLMTCRPAGV